MNYFIVRDQYNFFFLRRGRGAGVGLGIRGCATVLVTGQYIALEILVRNITQSGQQVLVSSNQGLVSRERSLKISEKQ